MSRILWLEDQVPYFQDIAAGLKALGYKVTFVENEKHFRQRLREERFDFAIIDIRGTEFNGIDIYRRNKSRLRDTIPVFLSAWLAEADVKAALSDLGGTVAVLDKVFPSGRKEELRSTFVAALENIRRGTPTETNLTYYLKEGPVQPDIANVGYENYVALSQQKRRAIRHAVLKKAVPEIQKGLEEGFVWFLISAPDGTIVDRRRRARLGFGSDKVNSKSVELGRPCFVYEQAGSVEEVRGGACPARYAYYFTVDITFDPSIAPERVHFDTGSERNWFDPKFLQSQGVGIGLDPTHVAEVGTVGSTVELEYWQKEVTAYVFDQEKGEENVSTQLVVNGVDRWETQSIGGRAPTDKLCDACKPHGRCVRRKGLLGQALLRDPKCFALELDGETGRTRPLFARNARTHLS